MVCSRLKVIATPPLDRTPTENRAFREKRRLPILYFEGIVQKSAIGASKLEESGYLHTLSTTWHLDLELKKNTVGLWQ